MREYRKVIPFNSGSGSRDTYLLVLYFAVAIVFFYIVSLNQRNYQDVWILDGIVVPTVVFVCFSIVIEMLIQENKKLVIFAAFFLFAMNLVVGLKYELFYGVYDSPGHFRFTNEMVSLGSIPEREFYSKSYGGNPGMHILMSCVSIVSGININDVFRFVFPVILSFIPFIIYFVTKDLLSDAVQKYTIIASSLPIIPGYVVWGTNFGMMLYLFLITIFLRGILTRRNASRLHLLFIIIGFGLIITHAVTALFVALLLIGSSLILKSLKMTRIKSFSSWFPTFTSLALPLIYLLLLITWWIYIASYNVDAVVSYVRALFSRSVAPIPLRFYQIPFIAQLQVLAVLHLGDFIMAMLSVLGLLIFLRKSRREEFSDGTQAIYLPLIILIGIILSVLSFQFISGFGALQYSRFLNYAIPLCSPFAGFLLARVNQSFGSLRVQVRKFAFAFFLFVLVSCCLVAFFYCQPLIPRANSLSSDLPEDEYITNTGMVNTIYQMEMLSFADKHSSKGRIASDFVTRDQMWGFSSPSFFSRHIWDSPLIPNPNQNQEWDLLLLHTAKAGVFSEPVEYRTRETIENLRLEAGNLIYDNGESFIVSHSP